MKGAVAVENSSLKKHIALRDVQWMSVWRVRPRAGSSRVKPSGSGQRSRTEWSSPHHPVGVDETRSVIAMTAATAHAPHHPHPRQRVPQAKQNMPPRASDSRSERLTIASR